MSASAFRTTGGLVLAAGLVLWVGVGVQAKPITTIGELATWDPNRPGDLPKSLAKVDPNAVLTATETLSVLPDMMTKMETVILNLTEQRTRARLDELLTSVLPNKEKKRPAAPAAIREFVLARISEKLEDSGATVPMAELENLVSAVEEGGDTREFVKGVAKQGSEIPLETLLDLVEKTKDTVRDYFRPTVMTHLEHGHMGFFQGLWADEADDVWSVSLDELIDHAKTLPKAVQDYVKGLPVFLMHHRMERAAPDVPLHQLMEMLADSRKAYDKMVAQPLVIEKDLRAPGSVAFMLQEAYARSEQINTDLVGRDVVGVIAVSTLLVLLSVLVGYIRVLDIPNRRITK